MFAEMKNWNEKFVMTVMKGVLFPIFTPFNSIDMV